MTKFSIRVQDNRPIIKKLYAFTLFILCQRAKIENIRNRVETPKRKGKFGSNPQFLIFSCIIKK